MTTSKSTHVRNHASGGFDEVAWTIETVRAFGMTTDIETAYELAKADEFPVKAMRIGHRYVVPVPAVLRLLDAE